MKFFKDNIVVWGFILALALIAVIFSPKIGLFKQNSTSNSSNKIQVATSFYPLYYFSSQIGGDKAQVTNITPSGAEPHDYDPSTQDIAHIEKANMLVLNGAVESWGNKIKDNLKGANVLIVTAGEGLENKQLTEDSQTSTDPHVWLDPQLAKKEVEKINQGFDKIDPSNSSYYDQNARNLEARLDQLDQTYKNDLANCQQRDIITSHAAFAYMGARYGLNQVAIAGLSPDAEPSSQQLADVANFARGHNVKYIFFESLVSPKLSETIANEVGAKTMVLDPIEGISDDDIKQGKDYFSVMADNLKNLQTALQCTSK